MSIRKFFLRFAALLTAILFLTSSAGNDLTSPKIPERLSRPKYSTFSELDGKPIGVQTGVDEWAEFAEKTFPHSKIVYYNTFTDIIAALNTHKI